jgi:hypothetical protein
MESYESLVALAMRAENLHVSGPIKFKIRRQTKNATKEEFQTHGYEVDLVGMRKDKLVLATVKSFFGSGGVFFKHLENKDGKSGSGYKMLNDRPLREAMIAEACKIYGYKPSEVEVRLYAGNFNGKDEHRVREWCSKEIAGGGPIEVYNLVEVIDTVVELAKSKTYIDDPALVAVKAVGIAEENRAKSAKKTKVKAEYVFEVSAVAEEFPVGTRVRAVKGDVVGVVIGYSNQQTSKPYLKIRQDETGVVWIRTASTTLQI